MSTFANDAVAACPPPQVVADIPSRTAVDMDFSIAYSIAQRTVDTIATGVRLSVVAREPEGRQLARAEAILEPNASRWRPALSVVELPNGRRVKLLYELQTECGDTRSATVRHQRIVDVGSTCELSAAPVLSDDAKEIVWTHLPAANGYDVCLQREGQSIRCVRTPDRRHRLEHRFASLDAATVTPHCNRGVGLSSVVVVR